ncbi:FxLYD domain-containing protein [Streptomyces diastatochromogenes]|uniref:FxLYD domain-containing protein n=1 Tax=Streptomyces diastatochromogenes TaxID=42236 RepID=UPI001ABFB484|nr:FxLYD domain-containing protein [Streptomyces diastatochromogenes]MCZ0987635.1 FxLYD domain-containing protein [Streptomyces diastatochromogenes]
MAGHWTRGAVGAVLAVVVAVGAAGCSDSGSPSGGASKAASAASSAAASLASKASDALASASAEAKQKLEGIKNGVKAKDDVTLGAPAPDSAGKATVKVTAKNTADSAKSFAVQVNFTDKSGNLLDVTVVTVKDVAAGASGEATATSNRKLTGEVHAVVGSALRY